MAICSPRRRELCNIFSRYAGSTTRQLLSYCWESHGSGFLFEIYFAERPGFNCEYMCGVSAGLYTFIPSNYLTASDQVIYFYIYTYRLMTHS